MNKSQTKRVLYLDILNILACIAVIILHHNGEFHTYRETDSWVVSLIFQTVFYWAVPVFLMITGATLMDYRKKYDTKTYFKKRFTKILIPLFFWTFIMFIWKTATGQITVPNDFVSLLNSFFSSEIELTYYFLFLIIGIYLTIPVLSKLTNDKKILWYIVVLLFITKSFLPPVLKLYGINYSNYLSIYMDGYLIFVILGYLLNNIEVKKKYRIIIYILGLLSIFYSSLGVYFFSKIDGSLNKLLFGYKQFHLVLIAVSVFLLIKNINWDKIIKKDEHKKILSKISGCSYGIYLIHTIIIYYEIEFFYTNIYSIWWKTVFVFYTYFISLFVVYMIKKIPFINKVVP